MRIREKHTIFCEKCGFEQESDAYGFLHNRKGIGEEVRYVSDWSRMIYEDLRAKVEAGAEISLKDPVTIKMIDDKKHKFKEVGEGVLELSRRGLCLRGSACGEPVDLQIAVGGFPTLPFSPGKHLEIQNGSRIYRCLPEDGRVVMKYINLIKVFHQLEQKDNQ